MAHKIVRIEMVEVGSGHGVKAVPPDFTHTKMGA